MKRSSIIVVGVITAFTATIIALGLGWFFFMNSQPIQIQIEAIIDKDIRFNSDIVNRTRYFFESRRSSETIMALVSNVSRQVPYFAYGLEKKMWNQWVKCVCFSPGVFCQKFSRGILNQKWSKF